MFQHLRRRACIAAQRIFNFHLFFQIFPIMIAYFLRTAATRDKQVGWLDSLISSQFAGDFKGNGCAHAMAK